MNRSSRSIRGSRPALASAALVLLVALPGFPARAQQGGADQQVARARLTVLTQQIAGVNTEMGRLDAELNRLLGQMAARERGLRTLQLQLEATAGQVAAVEAAIQWRQDALDRRAAEIYMTPSVGLLDALLSAQSLRDADDVLYFMESTAQSDADLIFGLQTEQTALAGQQGRLEELRKEANDVLEGLRRSASGLGDRLARQRALADQLTAERQAAAALALQLGETRPHPTPSDPAPDPEPPKPPKPPDPGPAAVKAMIGQYFGPLGQDQVDIALCVAEAESGFDPHAENPATGAAGVFQFIPSTWTSLSEAAGWGGSSVFEAEANVAVAAWTVEHAGWGGWPVAKTCGA